MRPIRAYETMGQRLTVKCLHSFLTNILMQVLRRVKRLTCFLSTDYASWFGERCSVSFELLTADPRVGTQSFCRFFVRLLHWNWESLCSCVSNIRSADVVECIHGFCIGTYKEMRGMCFLQNSGDTVKWAHWVHSLHAVYAYSTSSCNCPRICTKHPLSKSTERGNAGIFFLAEFAASSHLTVNSLITVNCWVRTGNCKRCGSTGYVLWH